LLSLADMRAIARYDPPFPTPPDSPSDKVPLDG